MKNYLFAPFENEDDKMSTWESCKSGIDQGIMIFLGRLESSYDVIISKLQAEIKDLRKGCKLLKDTSHYPKEYKAEAEEYFHHNPQCKKLLFFILDGNDFDWDEDNDGCNGMNGEYNGILYADDCIAEYDNDEGSN